LRVDESTLRFITIINEEHSGALETYGCWQEWSIPQSGQQTFVSDAERKLTETCGHGFCWDGIRNVANPNACGRRTSACSLPGSVMSIALRHRMAAKRGDCSERLPRC
jgi:hypothetical protein